MKHLTLSLSLFICCTACLCAAPTMRSMSVDRRDGVLRWDDDKSEVALFGVNYYPPFSVDYSAITDLGLNHEEVIRQDVAHFARLGLNTIRLHCWDREISDLDGNLIDNEHLRLLDFLIAECAQHGIYTVLTPIAWWGAKPEYKGFSTQYKTIREMTTQKDAWEKQARYLEQFVNHVNRYRGKRYADDEAVAVFELINEPLYPDGTSDELVTDYINTLTNAVRKTGTRKGIFYNTWANRIQACANADIDGVSNVWYPTGLVAGRMLSGNHLYRVDDYPSLRDERLAQKAKIIYEFDAADVHTSYMYPAIAREFRHSGVQIATQFQYDAMALADSNCNWKTHYLNLVYTPGKALSFAIAAEAFRNIPRGKDYGSLPENQRFANARLDPDADLSEWLSDNSFLHSNSTTSTPPAPRKLTRIWGVGSSPVVRYQGSGAYFLDKVADGDWLLEVYPDTVMLRDPYSGSMTHQGSHTEKVRLVFRDNSMQVNLPDLKGDLVIQQLAGAKRVPTAIAGTSRAIAGDAPFQVSPGCYRLCRQDRSSQSFSIPPSIRADFVLPPPRKRNDPALRIDMPVQTLADERALPVVVEGVLANEDDQLTLVLTQGNNGRVNRMPMTPDPTHRNHWLASVNGKGLGGAGRYQVRIEVSGKNGVSSFPGGLPLPNDPRAMTDPLPLIDLTQPVKLAEPVTDEQGLLFQNSQDIQAGVLRMDARTYAAKPDHSSLFVPFTPAAISAMPSAIASANAIRITLRGGPQSNRVELSLVQDDGQSFCAVLHIGSTWTTQTVLIDDLRPHVSATAKEINLAKVNQLRLIAGKWLYADAADLPHNIEIKDCSLIYSLPYLSMVVLDEPLQPIIAEFSSELPRATRAGQGARTYGRDQDSFATLLSSKGFTAAGSSVSLNVSLPVCARAILQDHHDFNTLILVARAVYPWTNRLELVISEQDGTPWGTQAITLSTEWQDIHIPIKSLTFFKHWKPSCPPDRGGEGDGLRVQNINRVNFCYGKWLLGDDAGKVQGVAIQELRLANIPEQP
ncbi:MAG: cellulase family glycosylhydrolase [Lentisphaeria bacterium]|nr:cellulase family glycosylhydrolase [Lentisphaeria bacterium]